jgi:tetratricopeptide (TPR) repeat protein
MRAGCLGEASVLAFLGGTLAEDGRAGVEAHLATCPACADLTTWVATDLANRSKAPGREGHPFVGRLAPGTIVDRYQVLGAIGRGGMAEVYAAYHPDLDRRIALKVVYEAGNETGERWIRLLREARTLARVSHPNVVHVYDAGTVDDGIYIAMELVEGETLAAWLEATPRDWRAVLDVFEAAGRGLAAAHAAQIVHRDFKPHNVMIGKDGAVRVTDFGLARSLDEGLPQSDGATGSQGPPLATITRTGAVVGTPAYMAPEQFRGEVPDAHADQFSFCVALHEALYGTRPALPHLRGSAETVAPPRAGVPTWLRTTVARGLSREPADRYPSMEALLAALVRGRRRRRRWGAVTAVGALLALVALAGWGGFRGRRISCAVPQDRLASAWSAPERRDWVHHAFAATGRASAETAWLRLSATLDDYLKQWATMYVDACEATHVRGEQSPEALDLRMSCLADGLDQVRALTEALTTTDGAAVSQAVSAANGLTPVSRCADITLLRSAVPLPRDERTLQTVLRLRHSLTDAEATRQMGAPGRAFAKAVAMRPQVEATGYRPLLGQLLLEIGYAKTDLGESDSERMLEDAMDVAEAARDDFTVAAAAAALVYVEGYTRGRPEESERWARLGAAVLDRLPTGYDSSRIRSWLLNNRAVTLWIGGEYQQAEAQLREAITLKERLLGNDHSDVGVSLLTLGGLLNEAGRPDEGLSLIDRALEIHRTRDDPSSLRFAHALVDRAYTLLALGRVAEARSAFREGIDVLEGLPFEAFASLTNAFVGLADTELAAAQAPAALAHLEHAADLARKTTVPPLDLADLDFGLARAVWDARGEKGRAVSLAREAQRAFLAQHQTQRQRDADAWLASHSLPSAHRVPRH